MKTRSMTPARAALLTAAFGVVFITAALTGPAGAHVLEGPHILELTAEAMGSIATLQVDQKLMIYPQTPEATPTTLDETATYVLPERFRSDILSEQVQRTHLVFGDHGLTVIDGRMAVDETPYDLYQRLLRSRTRPRLMRTLNRLGVETAIASLGRLDEKVVFVVGARYPDESVSQLAVDKETFLPIRLLLTEGEQQPDGSRLEIFYHNWQKSQSGWFPWQVLFYLNGRLAREIRVTGLRLNPSIPADMMDLEALKASVAARDADAAHGHTQEAVEAVQQGVEDVQKKFE
ncbi:hypothetical protein [Desulfosarcina sp.]|uniref:hypothetical protein n=1 Tax=Desulfosarcina sp. TaxID=2027861 RepID=UPI003970D3A0